MPREMGEMGWIRTRAKLKRKKRRRILGDSDVKVLRARKIRMVPMEKGETWGSMKCNAGNAISVATKAGEPPKTRETKK